MLDRLYHILFLLALLLLWQPHSLCAQVQTPGQAGRDSSKTRLINIDHADTTRILQRPEGQLQKLIGAVELSQDSIIMYCDSAILINEQDLSAYGNVIIQQGDSLSVFADSVLYNAQTQLAKLKGEVVLVNKGRKLFTQQLNYDLSTKVATYTTGATLTNDSTQLSSRTGYYYVDEQLASFKDSVVVVDDRFSLRADTLGFLTEKQIVLFLGPTLITNDSSRVYTEDGYYNLESGEAAFTRNAQYRKGEQRASADSIFYFDNQARYVLQGNARVVDSSLTAVADFIEYLERTDESRLIGNARVKDEGRDVAASAIYVDGRSDTYRTRGRSRIVEPPQILEADSVDYDDPTGKGLASGNVVWRDTSADLTIRSDRADYRKESNYLLAIGGTLGRPELITTLQEDSLFMSADTLLGTEAPAVEGDTVPPDSARLLRAFHDVRIFKSDLQARSDSMTYNSRDSMFVLYSDPVIWSDTTQFTADTIRIFLRDNQIHRIHLRSSAFIATLSDSVFYNQIRGKDIYAFFVEGELDRMRVIGNAETIYYPKDDAGAYVGVNKSICSEMLIEVENNELNKIKYLTQPKSELLPIDDPKNQNLRLKGFKWVEEGRPLRRLDIFPSDLSASVE